MTREEAARAAAEKCPWYARWWHARCRAIDESVMLPSIMDVAVASEERKLAAWELFKAQEGQEHWRCPCALLAAAEAGKGGRG